MGYYIDGPLKGKAQYIIDEMEGEMLSKPPVQLNEIPEDKALICVLHHETFDAAGYCYNQEEMMAFDDPTETRHMTWLLMPKDRAIKESGYIQR